MPDCVLSEPVKCDPHPSHPPTDSLPRETGLFSLSNWSVGESSEGSGYQWVVAETSGIGSNSPLRSISRTRASWAAMSASISATIAWYSGSSCSDSRFGS